MKTTLQSVKSPSKARSIAFADKIRLRSVELDRSLNRWKMTEVCIVKDKGGKSSGCISFEFPKAINLFIQVNVIHDDRVTRSSGATTGYLSVKVHGHDIPYEPGRLVEPCGVRRLWIVSRSRLRPGTAGVQARDQWTMRDSVQ